MSAPHSQPRPGKAQTFRADIFQPTSPPRVRSEPQHESKRSHLHELRHHYRDHREHKEHKDHGSRGLKASRHARDIVQSAIQPPTSFGDLLKQASGRSKDNTPEHSSRASLERDRGGAGARGENGEGPPVPPKKLVRKEDVEAEREKAKAREVELRSQLQSLSDRSLKTSRNLDDTYYAFLEKISTVRQAIGNLQELSDVTKELQHNFRSDADEVAEEMQGQIDGFGNFDAQQSQVADLETRIHAGREKAAQLTARLEEARKHVEGRAKTEAESEARTSRRLRIFWATIAVIAAVNLIIILLHRLRPGHTSKESGPSIPFGSRESLADAPISEVAKRAISRLHSDAAPRQSGSSLPSSMPTDPDKVLHIFDEL